MKSYTKKTVAAIIALLTLIPIAACGAYNEQRQEVREDKSFTEQVLENGTCENANVTTNVSMHDGFVYVDSVKKPGFQIAVQVCGVDGCGYVIAANDLTNVIKIIGEDSQTTGNRLFKWEFDNTKTATITGSFSAGDLGIRSSVDKIIVQTLLTGLNGRDTETVDVCEIKVPK